MIKLIIVYIQTFRVIRGAFYKAGEEHDMMHLLVNLSFPVEYNICIMFDFILFCIPKINE